MDQSDSRHPRKQSRSRPIQVATKANVKGLLPMSDQEGKVLWAPSLLSEMLRSLARVSLFLHSEADASERE